MDPFERDILAVKEALQRRYGPGARRGIEEVSEKLIALHRRNQVKINHSVMELVLAAYLIDRGYAVDPEHPLENDLIADLMAWRDGRSMIVEVETGFTSPENALDPQAYLTARVISKLARYSLHADRFSLATPAHNILQIPKTLLKPSRRRKAEDVNLLKTLCDRYYKTPEIALEKLTKMRLHSIYIINVDLLDVVKLTPRRYLERFGNLCPDKKLLKRYLGAGLRRSVAYEHPAT